MSAATSQAREIINKSIVIDTLGRLQAAVDQVEPVPDDVPAP